MDHTAGTIRVGKESLAVGLFWQPAPNAGAAAREARIVASRAEMEADLFCVRRHGTAQFGLGQRRAGHRPRMRAVAACLANGVGETSWLGVFAVEEGWLYVMVRKGAIMPDGDLLFGSEQEARERLRVELSLGGWDAVFAPAAWQLSDSRDERLAELLRAGGDARMRPVVASPLKPILVAAGVALAGGGIWTILAPPAPAPVAVPDVPVVPPPPPLPWHDKPKVGPMILACQRAIETTGLIPGYELAAVTCNGGAATAVYQRREGTLSWLPRNSVAVSPDRATVTTPLPPGVVVRTGEERPWNLDALRRRLWGAAQGYLLDSEISEPPAAGAALLPGRSAADGPQPGFREVKVSLGGRLPPRILADILGAIPALVVDEVSWQPLGWKVKGKAYVR